MEQRIEEKFTQIVEDALRRASSVDCSIVDYYAGLTIMREHVNNALDSAAADGVDLTAL